MRQLENVLSKFCQNTFSCYFFQTQLCTPDNFLLKKAKQTHQQPARTSKSFNIKPSCHILHHINSTGCGHFEKEAIFVRFLFVEAAQNFM